ncbi:FimB/Mfa2 family fimbrial subunit [Bacteroides sp.]|uniref:FimB/Mfa2 family fimbrial subunit n=1 Tax=Bacteroides sp. TaxID=29523 RepID=UPI0023D55162|nr:FimB/Mfa2 family fimbrial subunit [Bacteroides sp.]MDE6216065.1 FimB/Mfa2 family fimbrial subunit [Bacteroides sp.]
MKHSIKTMLLTTALLCGFSGCIKEDRSECNPGALLKFDYSLNPEYTNLFGDEVGKVTVYVFDENGLYYDRFSDAGKHLTNDWEMRLPLPPGNYTTVTWGGPLGTMYRIGETNADETAFQSELKKGVTHISNFMLTAENNGQPLVELDALYHGKADVTSVYWPEESTTVDLMKDTKLLTVTVKDKRVGQSKADAVSAPYEIYCTGTNARYLADNSFGKKAETITNLPYNTYTTPGRAISELNLMRLTIGRSFRLVVKDKEGKIVFDKDLVETMQATGHYNTQEDFDREPRYDVVINMDGDTNIIITINGWEVVYIIPGL